MILPPTVSVLWCKLQSLCSLLTLYLSFPLIDRVYLVQCKCKILLQSLWEKILRIPKFAFWEKGYFYGSFTLILSWNADPLGFQSRPGEDARDEVGIRFSNVFSLIVAHRLLYLRCQTTNTLHNPQILAVWPDGSIIFQYFAIGNIDNLPDNVSNSPKVGSAFCQIRNKKIAKVSKFRQIWSHWILDCIHNRSYVGAL